MALLISAILHEYRHAYQEEIGFPSEDRDQLLHEVDAFRYGKRYEKEYLEFFGQ